MNSSLSSLSRKVRGIIVNTDVVYLSAGVALLLAATVPRIVRNRAVSAPLVVLAVGAVVGVFLGNVDLVSPVAHPAVAEHVSEGCVSVALMGVGLAIDRPLGLRSWNSTWRLLGIALLLGAVRCSLRRIRCWPPTSRWRDRRRGTIPTVRTTRCGSL